MNNRALIGILCLALAAVSANGCKKAGTTLDNLKAAIVGETTASAKYAAYAQKAREEKFEAIAMLFRPRRRPRPYMPISTPRCWGRWARRWTPSPRSSR